MKTYDWKSVAAIVNYGLESQRNIADLNKVSSEIIQQRNYDEVLNCFQQLLAVSGEQSEGDLVKKERYLDELQAELTNHRLEIMKEGILLEQLRHTNEDYTLVLEEEIKEAETYLKVGLPAEGRVIDAASRREVLRKRIGELRTSKTVAESFSAQLALSENNCKAMSKRIWNVVVTVIPLLRGRITMETSQTVIQQAQKILRESVELPDKK